MCHRVRRGCSTDLTEFANQPCCSFCTGSQVSHGLVVIECVPERSALEPRSKHRAPFSFSGGLRAVRSTPGFTTFVVLHVRRQGSPISLREMAFPPLTPPCASLTKTCGEQANEKQRGETTTLFAEDT